CLPDERARQLYRLALELEEIEDQDDERQRQQPQRDPRIDRELVADRQVFFEQPVDLKLAVEIEQDQDDENQARQREQEQPDHRDGKPGAREECNQSFHIETHRLAATLSLSSGAWGEARGLRP